MASPFAAATGAPKSPSQQPALAEPSPNSSAAPADTSAAAPPAAAISGAPKPFSPQLAAAATSKTWPTVNSAQGTNTSRADLPPSKPAEGASGGAGLPSGAAEVQKPAEVPSTPQKSTVPPTRPQIITTQSQPTTMIEKSDSRYTGLSVLPSIATAASAMQIDSEPLSGSAGTGAINTSDGTTNASVGSSSPVTPDSARVLVDVMQAHMLNTPLSAHPMSADITTPITPGFSMSATTPTTPYTPTQMLTPGGGRTKHVCHHCNQNFTRHHNLKSHLLTHSHEKPFPCQQCTARFRRLHDLKRHSKLHTGERPHTCEKCGRKFARGDALARHARGEGGCAGRRTSIGGMMDGDTMMGGDGTDGDEDLNGLLDDGDTPMGDGDPTSPSVDVGSDGTPETILNAPSAGTSNSGARRPASLPSIKTNVTDNHSHLQSQHQSQIHQIQQLNNYNTSTYPPMTPSSTVRPSPGTNLFPPTTGPQHGKGVQVSNTGSPSIRTSTTPMTGITGASASILSSSRITESPRPITPATQDVVTRVKSPLSQFHANKQYAPPMTPQSAQPRELSLHAFGGNSPGRPPTSSPSQQAPQATMGYSGPQQLSQSSKNSPPPTTASTASSVLASTTNTSVNSTTTSSTTSEPGNNNQINSTPPPPQPPSSLASNSNVFENTQGIWNYVRELERRVAELESKQRIHDDFFAQAHQQSLAAAAMASPPPPLPLPQQQQISSTSSSAGQPQATTITTAVGGTVTSTTAMT
ncbi:hypothetical protein DFH27DRAFT_609171 [Peziza echinospora]|nr:hypothetical protein DFH27DRAFT_609171 [Peziza echinospora]